MNRLQRYRELMRTLDPSGNPRAALKEGWGVERPASATAETIARRIELEPWSSHLIVGGIGSGKTTELWRIHERLRELGNETGDVVSYIDIASETSLDRITSGALVAIVGQRLAKLESTARARRGQPEAAPQVRSVIKKIRELADGYSFQVPIPDDEPPDEDDMDMPDNHYEEHVEGVLAPTHDPLRWSPLRDFIYGFQVLQKSIAPENTHFLFLIDSLDRVTDMARIEGTLSKDVLVLKRAGIGVVVVGPMRLRYDRLPSLADLFEQNVHEIVEVEPVSVGLDFLVAVLSRRASPEILPPESCIELAKASGGVLRDLIALAKNSAQEAYGSGSDIVGLVHIARATEQFGRVRAVGLDSEQIQVLKRIRETGALVIRGEREISLLETRRVLDYGGGRFVVHPTLAPLLDLITVAA
jgi:hypothetical protein